MRFEKPEIEFIEFDADSVIVTSTGGGGVCTGSNVSPTCDDFASNSPGSGTEE